jgi:SAM-dependent methyltransferase
MDQPAQPLTALFHEVFEALPRQGPGNRACTQRALALCIGLPPAPAVLDLGCGSGASTLHLAELTAGTIVAVDLHAPAIERLRATLAARGLTERVRALVGDMGRLDLPAGSFDLVWSEGALYQLGLDAALRVCHALLRPGGSLAFTDAVWRTADPPAEVRAAFVDDYPTMGQVPDVLAAIGRAGFVTVGHFTLPDEAWWDDFYTPMQQRIAALRAHHAGNREAVAALDLIAAEPEMHRRHSDCYAYECFVARRA